MVTTATAIAEQRVLLQNISWQLFESLLTAMGENRAVRVSYHNEKIEFMTPLPEHERPNRRIEAMIVAITDELNLNVEMLGSMTLKRSDLNVGKEPDSCYYIQNEGQIRGKSKIDLSSDPPPDLALEIDITSSSLNQLYIYAVLGVPEVWRYDGNTLEFYHLQHQQYVKCDRSPTFPFLLPNKVIEFLEECQSLGVNIAIRQLRVWLQERLS